MRIEKRCIIFVYAEILCETFFKCESNGKMTKSSTGKVIDLNRNVTEPQIVKIAHYGEVDGSIISNENRICNSCCKKLLALPNLELYVFFLIIIN